MCKAYCVFPQKALWKRRLLGPGGRAQGLNFEVACFNPVRGKTLALYTFLNAVQILVTNAGSNHLT